MQFRVFPNYDTFLQRVPNLKKKHYIINDIYITSNNAFWFSTDNKKVPGMVNMNGQFVHLHKDKSIDKFQFDEKPYKVTRDNFKYDPKKKQLIIGESILPWKSPIWVKSILGSYSGSSVPKKKTKIKGDWILDRFERIIYLILDYAPIIRGRYIPDEPASKEQLDYAIKIEKTIYDLSMNIKP